VSGRRSERQKSDNVLRLVRSYGHMGIWSYGHTVICAHGHMGTYDHMVIIWSYGHMGMGMVIWAYGHGLIECVPGTTVVWPSSTPARTGHTVGKLERLACSQQHTFHMCTCAQAPHPSHKS